MPLGSPSFSRRGVRPAAARRRRADCRPSCAWFTSVFGQKLDQIRRQQALAEGDRQQGRERSLLYSIINAVTDPILLTDTEGRLLIANARALTLFTASEEESEGRRGAVRMNNMLLSSALSRKAIEETGAARRELLLVDPVDGSDLLFELLEHRHRGSARRAPASCRFCATSPTCGARARRSRRTTASCASPRRRRAPRRDRLNLIIDSVADPIVVTDAERRDVADERAGRAAVHGAARRQRRRAALACRPTTRTSRRSSPACCVSADQRRVGEIGLIDPQTGEPMPVEAIAGKILSEHGELTAVVTILHDRREALEKARLYEQLKQASDELEREDPGGDRRLAHAERAAAPPGDRAGAGVAR